MSKHKYIICKCCGCYFEQEDTDKGYLRAFRKPLEIKGYCLTCAIHVEELQKKNAS